MNKNNLPVGTSVTFMPSNSCMEMKGEILKRYPGGDMYIVRAGNGKDYACGPSDILTVSFSFVK